VSNTGLGQWSSTAHHSGSFTCSHTSNNHHKLIFLNVTPDYQTQTPSDQIIYKQTTCFLFSFMQFHTSIYMVQLTKSHNLWPQLISVKTICEYDFTKTTQPYHVVIN